MRDTWIGSGIYSTDADRTLSCGVCNHEWDEVVYFNDSGVCDERYSCPKCYEYVYYFEDRREPTWEE
jgi:hypothetical protein